MAKRKWHPHPTLQDEIDRTMAIIALDSELSENLSTSYDPAATVEKVSRDPRVIMAVTVMAVANTRRSWLINGLLFGINRHLQPEDQDWIAANKNNLPTHVAAEAICKSSITTEKKEQLLLNNKRLFYEGCLRLSGVPGISTGAVDTIIEMVAQKINSNGEPYGSRWGALISLLGKQTLTEDQLKRVTPMCLSQIALLDRLVTQPYVTPCDLVNMRVVIHRFGHRRTRERQNSISNRLSALAVHMYTTGKTKPPFPCEIKT